MKPIGERCRELAASIRALRAALEIETDINVRKALISQLSKQLQRYRSLPCVTRSGSEDEVFAPLDPSTPPTDDSPRPETRFEATLHLGDRQGSLALPPSLDLDRLPSPPDEMRVLLTAEEAGRVAELGFEVRLVRAHPVHPLDRARVFDDEAADQWLEERLGGLDRQGGT